MLPIKELSTNSDRTDCPKESSPPSHAGLAEFILLAFITHSIGLSIHPRLTGVSSGRDFSSDPKTCQRAVAEPCPDKQLRLAATR